MRQSMHNKQVNVDESDVVEMEQREAGCILRWDETP